jgi:hypothetical protein
VWRSGFGLDTWLYSGDGGEGRVKAARCASYMLLCHTHTHSLSLSLSPPPLF